MRSQDKVHLELMGRFANAWNSHDIETLIDCMHPDGVYEASVGTEAHGQRFAGAAVVRQAYTDLLKRMPNAQWSDASHFVCGNRGVTEWRFTATAADGTAIEADGCDLLTFRDGLILRKSALRKIRS